MAQHVWGDGKTQFFTDLSPEVILDSIDKLGPRTTGRCLALNSMENRVFEIEIEPEDSSEERSSLVAKFYRPGRWSQDQILEEHQFLTDLKAADISVIAPLSFEGKTLFQTDNKELYFSVFPRRGGRAPQEMNDEQLQILGRTLGRIHQVGASRKADHRLPLTPDHFGKANLNLLLELRAISPEVESRYQEVVLKLCELMNPLFKDLKVQRIHGDCHWGNIIWREGGAPYFLDFDDMLVGPKVQDIWLIVSGDDSEAIRQREVFLEAYESMVDFDRRELALIEPLRALRFIHFSTWMASRYQDPSFQKAFPQFLSWDYWPQQLRDLEVQLQKIEQGKG